MAQKFSRGQILPTLLYLFQKCSRIPKKLKIFQEVKFDPVFHIIHFRVSLAIFDAYFFYFFFTIFQEKILFENCLLEIKKKILNFTLESSSASKSGSIIFICPAWPSLGFEFIIIINIIGSIAWKAAKKKIKIFIFCLFCKQENCLMIRICQKFVL